MNAHLKDFPAGLIRREFTDISIKSVNADERSFEVIASTDSIDSHGDVVEQKFDLTRYKKNPVVLFAHNSFGFFDGARPEDFLPIGHAKDVRIEGGKLIARIVLIQGSPEQEPLVDKIWRRVQQDTLRAVSIGFRPGKVTEEKKDGKTFYKLSDNELFEISVVPIPSNPDAVRKSLEKEHTSLAARVEKTIAPAPVRLVPRAPELATNEAHLIKALDTAAQVKYRAPERDLLKEGGRWGRSCAPELAAEKLDDGALLELLNSKASGSFTGPDGALLAKLDED